MLLLRWILCLSWIFVTGVAFRFADHITSNDINQVTFIADIPPPTATDPALSKYWNRSDELLARCWKVTAGFERSTDAYADTDRIVTKSDKDTNHAITCYGEVTSLGTRQLAYAIMNTDGGEYDDVRFYDLGSGVGRLTAQFFFDQPYRMQKSVGVELALDRHEIAIQALNCIHHDDDYSLSIPIQYFHGDILELDWSDASHVFVSSLCFPKHILESLQIKLVQIQSLQVVAALNRLDRLCQEGWIESEAPIQMSWGPGIAKMYRRSVE